LADGSRVDKDSARVETYGTVDEANSWVGLARASTADPLLERILEFLQHRFFNCSSNLATPRGASWTPPTIVGDDIEWMERAIDRLEEKTGALNQFIVPGGHSSAGFLHVARTVCRRAERLVVTLARHEPVDPLVRTFINRSSDLLFAAARYANHVAGVDDVAWQRDLLPPQL
jgi:cob(I)alamin adenosyltransferase